MAQDPLQTVFEEALQRMGIRAQYVQRGVDREERCRRATENAQEEARNRSAESVLATAFFGAKAYFPGEQNDATYLTAVVRPFARSVSDLYDYERRMCDILRERFPSLKLLKITRKDGRLLTKLDESEVWAVYENDYTDWRLLFWMWLDE